MRKQGLVHLHALCTLLREDIQNRDEFETGAFDCENQTASPASIHRPKAQHRQAVHELTAEIAATVDPGGPGEAAEQTPGTD